MKKFLTISMTLFSLFLFVGCKNTPKNSPQGEWLSFSGNKIDLPKKEREKNTNNILELIPSTSEKINFMTDKIKLNNSEYKLDKKKQRIYLGQEIYSYSIGSTNDILKLGPEKVPKSDWTTYYRVGSKAEKEKQTEIKNERVKKEKSISKLNQTWVAKANKIEASLKEAMVGTWSGNFTSVATTGLGVAWPPGVETISFYKDSKVSFHASSSDLTNFESQTINNGRASYQINGILGLEPSDTIPKDPEKLLKIIEPLTIEEIFTRIKMINFSYDITTKAGTISQSFMPTDFTYKNGNLSFDEVLLITQCGDQGVQVSGNIYRVKD
ncbi:hypothetical protein [Lactococcus garvieae]|uniref:hypothetical protein n=1 Tax=Lactococcus garvieae TaxID=1363 RepID=UPI0038546186